MYSNKSDYDYGQRRPHKIRGSRPWGEEDRREERKEPSRNSTRDLYDKYSKDGHNRSDRMSSSDFGEPHTSAFDADTDWRKKRTSSYERSASENRRRTLDNDDDYRYQHEPEDSYRKSPEKYPLRSKDFHRTLSSNEGYSRRRSPEESRYSQNQDERLYSQYQEDSRYRPATEYYKDRDSRERSRSRERTRPQDPFTKSYTPPHLRSDGFSRDPDHNQNRTRFSLNGSSRLAEPSHRRLSPPPPPPPPPLAAATGEKKMSKGFQRFLDVLNQGVNVETLTKIVTQGSPDVDERQKFSPHVDRLWTAESSQRQQKPQYWPQSERSQRPASPLSRSYSSNGKSISEEKSSESRPFERKCLSPIEKNPSFDDEHKNRQVHDVLQAIGINLEFEELGQMSSRIQERLYGKKQTDSAARKEEEEREKRRQAYVPKRRSRSSSGSSSSSSFQDHRKSHSHREEIDFSHQTDSYSHSIQHSSSKYTVEGISTHHRPNPEPASMPSCVIPPPSAPVNCLPSPYSNPPPTLSPVMPNMYMQPPPFLSPYTQTPHVPPLNMFPPGGSLSTPFPQPSTNCRRHPYLNLLMVPPSEHSNYLNTLNQQTAQNPQKVQKTNKNLKRPRYLQEVNTKK